jgi:small toxic polypeptide LdrA/B/C/D
MTLAQLGLVLWDDLAAPVIAGILVSIIVSGWITGSSRPVGICLP